MITVSCTLSHMGGFTASERYRFRLVFGQKLEARLGKPVIVMLNGPDRLTVVGASSEEEARIRATFDEMWVHADDWEDA